MANLITVNTRHLGEIKVDFDDLSAGVQQYLIAYGLKQSIDDAGADPEKAAKGSEERLKGLLAGVVPAGRGGGARLGDFEKAVREVVERYLRGAGMKAADATKAAKKPEDAFKGLLRLQLAKAKALKPEQVSDETLDAAFDANWAKVESQAQKMVEAAKAPSLTDLLG